jgi:hypothetical protein
MRPNSGLATNRIILIVLTPEDLREICLRYIALRSSAAIAARSRATLPILTSQKIFLATPARFKPSANLPLTAAAVCHGDTSASEICNRNFLLSLIFENSVTNALQSDKLATMMSQRDITGRSCGGSKFPQRCVRFNRVAFDWIRYARCQASDWPNNEVMRSPITR